MTTPSPSMPVLLPCKFCPDGRGQIAHNTRSDVLNAFVQCDFCGARGPIYFQNEPGNAYQEYAIRDWNRRAKPDMPSDEVIEKMCAAFYAYKSLEDYRYFNTTERWRNTDRINMRAALLILQSSQGER